MDILHLEDNQADAELVEAIIEQEWPGSSITRLATRPQFEAALRFRNFDLILSDHSMPGFDGQLALEIAKTACPETPFIFVSGTIGEEQAIHSLQHGAADYVLKGAPARLAAAIRGAVERREAAVAKRRAEESLRESRDQFRQIAEDIDDFIVLADARGECLYCNPAFRNLLGAAGPIAGYSVLRYVHPDDSPLLHDLFARIDELKAPVDLEYRLLLPDGIVRHLEARISPPKFGGGETPALMLVGRDVTARKQAEAMLHEQASLLEKARDAIYQFALNRAVTYWNPSAERIYGLAAARTLGHSARDVLFANQPDRFDTAFALTLAHGEWKGEFEITNAEGQTVIVDSTWSLVNDVEGGPRSILCIDSDVTRRKQLERELQRSQRTESLGLLAGGIAHDLNNILSPILLSVGLLRPLVSDAENGMILDTLETSASHGVDLVRQILLFARGGEGHRVEVDMRQLLGELKGFLKLTLRGSVELQVERSTEVWPVLADATQLKQVLVNLCINARDAMPTGGQVRISAANERLSPGNVHGFHGEIAGGNYVRLSVSDSGTGIPPEHLEKVFDPFFTTKAVGKGTGLGLSTIAGIVRQHEGAIAIQTVLGKGTTFHIYLPATNVPAEPAVPPVPVPPPTKGRGEGVLVVDDDEGIRLVAEKILTGGGYRVWTAADGTNGLRVFAKHRSEIDAVICDEMMPGMRGSAVLKELHRLSPQTRLIAMSGLFESGTKPPVIEGASVAELPKPLTIASLLAVVRRSLDEAGHVR